MRWEYLAREERMVLKARRVVSAPLVKSVLSAWWERRVNLVCLDFLDILEDKESRAPLVSQDSQVQMVKRD